MKDLISIAMPVYNCSNYIQICIKSILLQTYTNWELLIVDDFSTDNTVELISSFNDERIKLYRNKENIGLAASLNLCIDKSNGEFIARMDGDDIMVLNRLEIQIDFLKNNPEIDVIGGLAYLVGSKNEILGYKKSINPDNFQTLLLSQGFFIHPTIMGKRSWFSKFKYNPSFKRGQDLELWIRSYNSSIFMNINKYLIFYREDINDYRIKYFNIYKFLKKIMLIHKKLIPIHLRFYIILSSYLKFQLFDILKNAGLIQKKQLLNDSEVKIIQLQLNKILK